jgi:hypothetical protein
LWAGIDNHDLRIALDTPQLNRQKAPNRAGVYPHWVVHELGFMHEAEPSRVICQNVGG